MTQRSSCLQVIFNLIFTKYEDVSCIRKFCPRCQIIILYGVPRIILVSPLARIRNSIQTFYRQMTIQSWQVRQIFDSSHNEPIKMSFSGLVCAFIFRLDLVTWELCKSILLKAFWHIREGLNDSICVIFASFMQQLELYFVEKCLVPAVNIGQVALSLNVKFVSHKRYKI